MYKRQGLRPVAVVTLLFAVFALVPKQEDGVWSLGVVQEQSQFLSLLHI